MSATTTIPTGTWTVDPSHSKVGFAVKHMGIATVRGLFNEFEGTLEIAGDLASAKAAGTVKAASVDTNEPQRDAHLRSADFFDADTHEHLSFESSRIEAIDEETYRIVGDLTLRGVTNELSSQPR
jgi:polyisoprenoid-binding protein YceI